MRTVKRVGVMGARDGIGIFVAGGVRLLIHA
jgi:hypothetical protein